MTTMAERARALAQEMVIFGHLKGSQWEGLTTLLMAFAESEIARAQSAHGSTTATEPPTFKFDVEDVSLVAGFVAGWFPGYEDGIEWGSDGPGGNSREHNTVYLAAKRLLDTKLPASPRLTED
jgi:hypothetical protein